MNTKVNNASNAKRRVIAIAVGVLLGVAGAGIFIAAQGSPDDEIKKSAQQIQSQVANASKSQAASAPVAKALGNTPHAEPVKPTELTKSGVPSEYDLNKDGKVAIQEVYDATLEKVLGFDKDADSKLNIEEFAASISASVSDNFVKEAFAEIDSDKDGFLSKDEVGNYVGPGIAEMDKDGDGFVDPLPAFAPQK